MPEVLASFSSLGGKNRKKQAKSLGKEIYPLYILSCQKSFAEENAWTVIN
jgi:hypothetical protein